MRETLLAGPSDSKHLLIFPRSESHTPILLRGGIGTSEFAVLKVLLRTKASLSRLVKKQQPGRFLRTGTKFKSTQLGNATSMAELRSRRGACSRTT